MLIDSPYFPDELELLPTVLAQSGFEPAALLATHGDFDHLLGRMAFPDLSLGVAESTMLRFREKPGEAQRDLRDYDSEVYVRRPAPAGARPDAVAAGAGKARAGRAGVGAAPGRGPHPGRDGGARAMAGGAVRGRLPQRCRDPVAVRKRLAGGLPGHARALGALWSSARRSWCLGTVPLTRASARWSCSTRTWATWTRWSEAARSSSPPGATPRDSARSTPRTSAAAADARGAGNGGCYQTAPLARGPRPHSRAMARDAP